MEVTAMNHQGKTISVPIANLHIKCLPMVGVMYSFNLCRIAHVGRLNVIFLFIGESGRV